MTSNSKKKIIPVLAAFFVMGFRDIVGISSDYMQTNFGWSSTMTRFVPSMVLIWFLFLGIPIGNKMDQWGRKNTALLSMVATIAGMSLPPVIYSSATCIVAYIPLGIGNAILQISLNPLFGNVIINQRTLTSSLAAGQVIKAISSSVGPETVLFVTLHFGNGHWYHYFPMLGGITLPFRLRLAATPIQYETSSDESVSSGKSLALLKNKTLLILLLDIFLMVGVDAAVNYINSKLMTLYYEWIPDEVKFAPQVYFLSRTIGAFLGVFLLIRISALRYSRMNILACALASLLLMFINGYTILNLICIGDVGLFSASVFSMIYPLSSQEFPTKMNQISGLMITAVASGGVVTPLPGIALDLAGVIAGLSIIPLCVLYLIYCTLGVKV